MGKLLVTLIVLAGLFFAADRLFKGYAEERLAGELQEELELTAAPDVSFDGWPFVTQFVGGEISEVSISGDNVGTGQIVFSEFEVELERVRFAVNEVLQGNFGSVRIGSGRGSAELDEATLNRILEREGAPLDVELEDDQVLATSPLTGGEPIPAEVSLEDGRLAIAPTGGGLQPIAVELPSLGRGFTYVAIRVEDGRAVFTIRGRGWLLSGGTR